MERESKKSIKVTEQVFNTVKFMVKGGASISQCAEAIGISTVTVSYIKRSETYENYKKLMYENSGGYKKKMKAIREREEAIKAEKAEKEEENKEEHKEEPKQESTQPVEHHITLVANQYMAEQLKKQTELLTLINNKLTLIAEDLGCFKEDRVSNL